LSFPIIPHKYTSTPSDDKLFATFAAPPKTHFSLSQSTIGTGASGEIRLVVPDK
jgi:hypothetical protein